MISQETFMGGGLFTDLGGGGGTINLVKGSDRIQIVGGGAPAGQFVILPDATTLETGGPHFYIGCGGPEDTLVKDNDGNLIKQITAAGDNMIILYLVDNSTPAGVWIFLLGAFVA